jgi:hypothetical protein
LEIEYSVATAAASRGTTTTPADPERLGIKCTSSLPAAPTASVLSNPRSQHSVKVFAESIIDSSLCGCQEEEACSPTSLKEIPKRVLLLLCFSVIVLDDVLVAWDRNPLADPAINADTKKSLIILSGTEDTCVMVLSFLILAYLQLNH